MLLPRSPKICAAHVVTSFVAHAYGKSENATARCCHAAAAPRRLNNRRLGPNHLNVAGGCPTISTVYLSLSQPTAGISRRCPATGLSQPRIWRSGLWRSGLWRSGLWRSGLWRSGLWRSGLWRSGLWRAGRSAAASAGGNPAAARRRYGLAAWVLGMAQARLGLGVRPLCLQSVPARGLGAWSLGGTTREVGLGAGPLAMTVANR